jgi:hypothetical protein
MATLTTTFQLLATLGGEDKRLDVLARKLPNITLCPLDSTIILAENMPSTSPVTLWTHGNHNTNTTQVETFKFLAVVADPDFENATALPIDLEITSTRNGSTTMDKRVVRIDRNNPYILGSSVAGQGVSEASDSTDLFTTIAAATPPRITRIRARNPNGVSAGANNVKLRTLILG